MSSSKSASKSTASIKNKKLNSSQVEMKNVSKAYGETWESEEVLKNISVE